MSGKQLVAAADFGHTGWAFPDSAQAMREADDMIDILGPFGAVVWALVLIAAVLWFYFLPAILASKRKHSRTDAIFALDLLLGWTFVFWVLALVWALREDNRRSGDHVIIEPVEEA